MKQKTNRVTLFTVLMGKQIIKENPYPESEDSVFNKRPKSSMFREIILSH